MTVISDKATFEHPDLVTRVLIASVYDKMEGLHRANAYAKYLTDDNEIESSDSLEKRLLSAYGENGIFNLVLIKSAVATWSDFPIAIRLSIMQKFCFYMQLNFPLKERHFKIAIFCRVFMFELLPILSLRMN